MNNSIGSFSLTPDMRSLSSDVVGKAESSESSASQKLMNSFGETLTQKLNQVESLQETAQTKMRKFASGKIENVHDVSIAMQKASMGLNIASAVRQKVLQGISELQQMG